MSLLPTMTWLNIPFSPLQVARDRCLGVTTRTRFAGREKSHPRRTRRLRSVLQQSRRPVGDRVPTAHVGLHHPVDHEGRRHMDTVLAGILAVPLDLTVEIGDRKR